MDAPKKAPKDPPRKPAAKPPQDEKRREPEKPRAPKTPGLLPNEERIDMGDVFPKK